jgi:Major Facilitator Superfamily
MTAEASPTFNINALRVSMGGIGASFCTPPTFHRRFCHDGSQSWRDIRPDIRVSRDGGSVRCCNGNNGCQSSALAFLIAGFLDTWVGWRYSFGLLVALAISIFILSKKLKPVERQPDLQIDKVGVVLAALAIILITVGFNNNNWGLLLCAPAAPVSLLGLSPAPVMIIGGFVLGQAFVAWSRKRRSEQQAPLVALDLIRTSQQRSVILLLFVTITLGSAVSFLVPLYIQIVQGPSSLQAGFAIIPYALSIFDAAVLVLRLYEFLPSRHIARYAFIVVAAGPALLAVVVRNEWETFMVIFGLTMIGLGQGALVTLLFRAMAATSSEEFAGDVGALRGTTANLAGAIGTAMAGALLIGLLSTNVMHDLTDNPIIPPELKGQVDLDNITFVSNDRLLEVLSATTAASNQVAEALSINTDAWLRSLKICLLAMAGLALMPIFPAGNLPNIDGES